MNQRIFSIGENAVTIEFGNVISTELNDRVLALAEHIKSKPFDGFIELVPAYSSLTVFYDLVTVKKKTGNHSSVFSSVRKYLEDALVDLSETKQSKREIVEIPVCYDLELAPDLEYVADNAGLSIEETINIHTSKTYRVFMIGFLPGFAYMGEVDARIATPRRGTPRTKVEIGSVGIAGSQTGVYPLESPGGWQIIGKTPVKMFQPDKENVSFLQTGDEVKFQAISKEEFYKF